jgi:hypothetical protein
VTNPKQKPVLEGIKRSPGKSKFSLPRKEVPPIDGSYLDRLFADYDKQKQELEGQGDADPARPLEASVPPATVKPAVAQVVESAIARITTTPQDEVPNQILTANPVPPSQTEVTTESQTERAAAVHPEPEQTVSQPETVVLLPRQKPATIPSSAPDGDTQLLDKWKKKHRLGKGEVKVLRVLLGLCRETDGEGCYLKIPHLMQAAELRERQTQLVLRNLRELGLIEKIAEYSNLDRLGIKYRVVIDAE